VKLLTILSLACLLVAACCVDGTSNPNLECDAMTPVVDGQQPDSTTLIDASVDAPVCGCPTLQPGDLFSVCGQTAITHYIIDPQGEVMYFPNGTNNDVFESWRDNEEGLITISQSCFDSLWVPVMYPGGVNYRPGLIRSQADWQQPAALRHSAEQHSGADLGPGGVRALCAG
jgi:hypothetical protein